MLQVKNSVVNTVSGAFLKGVIAITSVTNCFTVNTISPTFITSTTSYSVSGDASAVGVGDQINLTPVYEGGGSYRISQTWANTNLVGKGVDASDIAAWSYYDAPVGNAEGTFTSVNTASSVFDGFVRLLGGFSSVNISTSTFTASGTVLDAAFSSVNTSSSTVDGIVRLSGSVSSANTSSSTVDGIVRLAGSFASANPSSSSMSFTALILSATFTSNNPASSAFDGKARLSSSFDSTNGNTSTADGFVRLISGFESTASSSSALDGVVRLSAEFTSLNESFGFFNGNINGIINPTEAPIYINLVNTVINVNLVRVPYEIELEG